MRDTVAALGQREFDVVIIGGGITGAGVARDAAMRGLRVALVEQNDFASGTSSRSSRLVHGGVRYLERGHVALVFEASRERRTLLRIAPHLVRPLRFTWPVYRGARIARWKLAVGLALYDTLALFRNVGRHRRMNVRDVRASEPLIRVEGLLGGACYWDASTDDARLTLANVLSARDAGAIAVNHARVVALLRHGERITGVRVADLGGDGRVIDVRARLVVNATGPWSDVVESLAHQEDVPAVRSSKGVHIIVPRGRIGNSAALTLTAPSDGRVMFVLPAGAFAIIGTTDTYDTVSPDDVRAGEDDIAYLLDAANYYFPDAHLARTDVVSAWAGLRPLAAFGGSRAGTPSSASREYAIALTVPGLLRVTGGKLTTYRSMAAQVTDAVERALGLRPTPCTTAQWALSGGAIPDLDETIGDAIAATGDRAIAERLVGAHGSAWRAVWAAVETDVSMRVRVVSELPYLLAELRYAVVHELACTLGDLLIRRTPIAFETRDHGADVARMIAPAFARWLGHPASWCADAIAEYDLETRRMFGNGPTTGTGPSAG
ncbi:MAG: glycerol-3-phosphate dehydrogenase/oxidase [Gemmatimonadota bacterium]